MIFQNATPHRLIFEGNVDADLYNVYKIYYFIIDAVFCLPATFGNILIILAIAKFSVLRKSTSCILICNLAVSDLLVGVVVFPIHMLLLQHGGVSKSVTFCLLHHSLVYTLVGTSVHNLFLLSLERFHAIVRPFTHVEVFTKRRMYTAVAFIWVCMFAYGFLPLFGWHKAVDDHNFTCGVTPLLDEVFKGIICSVISLSMLVNGIFFFIIVHVAMKAANAFTDVNVTEEQRERTRKDVYHTRMMLIVSGLFILFWGPFCILTLVPNPSTMVKLITAFCASFGLVNSSLNWVVYGFRSKKFRIAFKALLTCNYDDASSEISNLMT